MITKEALLLLLGDRPVAYHPMLAKKLGGVEVAVFVSQLLYWTGRSKLAGGWIFKTQAEFEEETGLTRRNQETARRRLRELGVLSEELRGIPATLHYRLNLEALANLLDQTAQTSMAEPAKLECTDQPNSDVQTSQTPESIIEYAESTPVGSLTDELLSVCRINIKTITFKQKQSIAQAIEILVKNETYPAQVKRFADFWPTTWRGKNGPPTPLQVCELWGEFEQWIKKPIESSDEIGDFYINSKGRKVYRVR